MTSSEFARFSRFIEAICGIKMPPSKKSMLEARLQKRLRSLAIPSFGRYCDYVMSREGRKSELVPMIDAVTTNKTEFFREPAHFSYLLERMLPDYYHECAGRRLNIWSAGCSSGEEPYTLAMVMEEFAADNPGFGFSILATDISMRMLEMARLGIYGEERISPVPLELKRKYFLRSRDRSRKEVRIAPEIRNKITFRRLNFMDDDFGIAEPVHVVFCRNVIIYFERQTQEKLIHRFCRALEPGGFLFLGHSESLNGLGIPLVQVETSIYRKPYR